MLAKRLELGLLLPLAIVAMIDFFVHALDHVHHQHLDLYNCDDLMNKMYLVFFDFDVVQW